MWLSRPSSCCVSVRLRASMCSWMRNSVHTADSMYTVTTSIANDAFLISFHRRASSSSWFSVACARRAFICLTVPFMSTTSTIFTLNVGKNWPVAVSNCRRIRSSKRDLFGLACRLSAIMRMWLLLFLSRSLSSSGSSAQG
eukprot:CAMPEP_0173183588 /NCGR_PEP_ID=MMETSP1141-20130122/8475_1 /TAXON_ID=483371 /ORGANISM="non described non described, Strain CCMP2298" /LENGTH=140 /DNA_ID=CAMNT_0014106807 /DNA_START=719 /DNA_END=1141 /DNA_ORIENTATION=+